MSEQPTYYKILRDDGAPHLGTGKWHLPKRGRPGKWMPRIGNIRMCQRGYHVVDAAHIIEFLEYGYNIFEVEVRGDQLNGGNKICVSQARLLRLLDWSESRARLFACDCAERALDLFGGEVDPRSHAAIEVSRRFARGEATHEELAAAGAAAWDTAGAAAWDTAGAAARAAAGAATKAAAWDAARAAARAAAWAAAGDAAGDAAWAAAGDAAWAAARDAARDAAWTAAGDAERKWQTNRLLDYLYGRVV